MSQVDCPRGTDSIVSGSLRDCFYGHLTALPQISRSIAADFNAAMAAVFNVAVAADFNEAMAADFNVLVELNDLSRVYLS